MKRQRGRSYIRRGLAGDAGGEIWSERGGGIIYYAQPSTSLCLRCTNSLYWTVESTDACRPRRTARCRTRGVVVHKQVEVDDCPRQVATNNRDKIRWDWLVTCSDQSHREGVLVCSVLCSQPLSSSDSIMHQDEGLRRPYMYIMWALFSLLA